MKVKSIFFLVSLSFSARGQYAESYPDVLATWFVNPSFSQSAYVPADSSKANLHVQYKSRTGPFSKIHTATISADRIFRNDKDGAHVFRMLWSDERMGPYISRLNAQFSYVFQQSLSKDISVCAGISGGMMQVSFTAPSATSFGSAKVPDGKAGVGFKKKKFQAGFSVLQLLNNSYRPLHGTLQLRRFSSVYITQRKDVSIRSSVYFFFRWDYRPTIRDNFQTMAGYSFRNIFQCSAGYGTYTGLTFFTGFTIAIGEDCFFVSLANNSPFLSPVAIPVNSLEFGGGYSVR